MIESNAAAGAEQSSCPQRVKSGPSRRRGDKSATGQKLTCLTLTTLARFTTCGRRDRAPDRQSRLPQDGRTTIAWRRGGSDVVREIKRRKPRRCFRGFRYGASGAALILANVAEAVIARLDRAIQYFRGSRWRARSRHIRLGVLDAPPSRGMTAEDAMRSRLDSQLSSGRRPVLRPACRNTSRRDRCCPCSRLRVPASSGPR